MRPRWNRGLAGGLAAAAAIALLVFFRGGDLRRTPTAAEVADSAAGQLASSPATRRLADGSTARLRPGAEIVEAFSAAERRVRLVRGEAIFTVMPDAGRPFLVESGDVTVRAVGTAFAVRMETHAVDVLVTEGTVQVTLPPAAAPSPAREAGRSVHAQLLPN